MTLRKYATRSAVLVAAATATLVGAVGTAQARPGLPDIYLYDPDATAVWCVQLAVNNLAQAHGFGRPLAQDGIFGPSTYDWVAWFQHTTHLPVDHTVGPQTGDQVLKYDGSYYGGHNYCYNYVPSTF